MCIRDRTNADPNPEKVLLALRYKNTIQAQIDIAIQDLSVLSASGVNDNHIYVVRIVRDVATQLRNATDTGPPVLNFSSIENSALEVCRPVDGVDEVFVVSDGFLGTSGVVITTGYNTGRSAIPSGPVNNSLRLGMSVAGVSDILVLSIYPLAAGIDMYGGVIWREL